MRTHLGEEGEELRVKVQQTRYRKTDRAERPNRGTGLGIEKVDSIEGLSKGLALNKGHSSKHERRTEQRDRIEGQSEETV